MSKRSRARRRRGAAPQRRRRLAWKAWLGWGAAAVVVIGLGAVLIRGPAGSAEDPSMAALAEENAGGPVRVLTGSNHTVYHSTLPLPSAASPRADGKATLVWFSGTWCEFCERMEPFVHATANRYAGRIVFVEKSVDHDRGAASRYGIRGTPTFVLVDDRGDELGRFFYQQSATQFAELLEAAVARAGG